MALVVRGGARQSGDAISPLDDTVITVADSCGDARACSDAAHGMGTGSKGEEKEDEVGVGCVFRGSCCSTKRGMTMFLLLTITCFLFMDQNLMAPNLTDIAKDFNFTDHERDAKLGGEISLSLFIVGAPVSLVVGSYADRVNRQKLYSAVVLIGELGCMGTFWVTEYWQLFVLRALTGISLGGAQPLIMSMVADMYPPEERPRATSYIGLSMGFGVGFGQALAAYVGSMPWGGWRLPFMLVSAPCILGLCLCLIAGVSACLCGCACVAMSGRLRAGCLCLSPALSPPSPRPSSSSFCLLRASALSPSPCVHVCVCFCVFFCVYVCVRATKLNVLTGCTFSFRRPSETVLARF
jgi:MFS family permease